MHKVPLWGAAFLLFILFFTALELKSESLWTAFGINLVLLIIGLIKAFVEYEPPYNEEKNSNNTNKEIAVLSTNLNTINTNSKKSDFIDTTQNIKETVQEFNTYNKFEEGLKKNDPEAIFMLALIEGRKAKTKEEFDESLKTMLYAASLGSKSAIQFLKT